MVSRIDVEFPADGGISLSGWLYVPGASKRFPAITMAHGYGGSREHGLERFALKFAENGFVVLLHDHRGFGRSGGEPRHDVDPWQQVKDWRRAISYLESREEVDAARIGLWGTSYAGGHALVLGATDRRLRCVVSQVPIISGYEQGLRRLSPDLLPAVDQIFAQDERAQLRGEPIGYQALVSDDPAVVASYHDPEAFDFYRQPLSEGVWENKVTVRSGRLARMYEPGLWAPRVSPTPLLMVIADHDKLTLTDLELGAYERALAPKRLVLIKGGHFAPYLSEFETAAGAAVDWFSSHLARIPVIREAEKENAHV